MTVRFSTLESIGLNELRAGRGTKPCLHPKLEITFHRSRVHRLRLATLGASIERLLTAMPSPTISELDTLFHHLQRRMVESGEWERYDLLFPQRGLQNAQRSGWSSVESCCSYDTN